MSSSDIDNNQLLKAIGLIEAGQTVEQVLEKFPDLRNSTAIQELISAELSYQHKENLEIQEQDYQRRFPEHAAQVQAAFELFRNASTQENKLDAGKDFIDEYALLKKLGEGGFGTTWKVRDKRGARDGQVHALKVLKSPNHRVSEHSQERIALHQIKHPNVVTMRRHLKTKDGWDCLVLEFIDGRDLRQVLTDRTDDVDDVLVTSWMHDICLAVQAVHDEGFLHLDIKPANVMMKRDASGRVPILIDLGLAIQINQSDLLREIRGTYRYMTPEMHQGKFGSLEPSSDVYSLGVLLYEMLTKKSAFSGTDEEVKRKVAKGEYRPIREVLEGRGGRAIPEKLAEICEKAMQLKSIKRFETAADMAASLKKLLVYPELLRSIETAPAAASAEASDNESRSATAVSATTKMRLPQRVHLPGFRNLGECAEDVALFEQMLPPMGSDSGLRDLLRSLPDRICAVPKSSLKLGFLLGASGSGKSSLIHAGLLPKLTQEATSRKLKLHIRCHECTEETLVEDTIPELLEDNLKWCLNSGESRADERVLIILDQFEQWLEHEYEEKQKILIEILKQADGRRLQFLAVIRSDFHARLTHLRESLGIRDKNTGNNQNLWTLEELHPRHAQHVLHMLGYHSGKLPWHASELTEDQCDFLEMAVRRLGGRNINMFLLSSFVEYANDEIMEWIPQALSACPRQEDLLQLLLRRLLDRSELIEHREAALQLLLELCPAGTLYHQETDGPKKIKVAAKSRSDLQRCLRERRYSAGSRNVYFDEMIRVLSESLRLITPVTEMSTKTDTSEVRYRLTHDSLIAPIRSVADKTFSWFEKTLRRRAENYRLSKLAEGKADIRQLPGFIEWLLLRSHQAVTRRTWTDGEFEVMRKADRHWLMIVVPMISLLLLVAILMQQHSATTTADVVKAKVLQLRTVPYSDIRTLIDELGNPAYRTLSCRQMLDDISSGECAPGALIRLCSGVLYLARPDDLKDIERSIETLLVNLGSLARGDEEGLQVVLPALKKHSAPCNKAVDRMLVAAVEGKPRACALMTGILLAENRERLRSLADLLYLDHGLDTETQTAMLANLSTWLNAADSAAGSVSSASEGLKAILVRDFPELETARGLRPHVAEELLATVVLQSMSTDRSFQGDKKFLEGISRRFTSSSLLSTIWGIDRSVFTRQIENPDWRLSYFNGRLTPFARITPPSAAQLSSVKPKEVFARLGAEASIKANLPASRATAASLLFYAGQFQDCHALLTEELLQFIEIFDNEMSKTLRRYQKISSRYIHQLVPPGSDSASGTAEESTVYDQLIADFTEAVTRSQDVAKTSSDIGELEEWTKALCLHSEFGMRITDDQRQILAELAVDCVERMTKLIREGGGEPYRIAADPGFIYLYKNARFQKIVTSLKPFWICVREAESGDVADVIRNARGPDALSFGDTERHPLIVSPFSEGVLYEIDRRWSTGERIRVELPSSDEWRYVANPCPWWVLQLRSQPTIGELFIQSKRFDAAPPTTGSKLPNAFGVFDLPGSHGEWLNDVLPPGDKALKRAGGGHWHSNDVFNDYESRVGIFGRGGLMAIRLVLRPI